MQTLLAAIAEDCQVSINRYEKVQGGDINESYCLHSRDHKYFLKTNNATRFTRMFETESEGLDALRDNSSILVPKTIKQGTIYDQQWLLLEWLEKGAPQKKSMENFGAALALMHRKPQAYFGWQHDNYIGSLQQVNTPCNSWAVFYTQYRIMPLIKSLFDKHVLTKQEINMGESFAGKAAISFPNESPALLHGDLWSGNYMITSNSAAALFDPAVYFGHREMDIGMTQLFGGFDQAFYNAYQEVYPLEKGWRQRSALTQLYPLLVHAVLFGGHYIQQVKEIIKK